MELKIIFLVNIGSPSVGRLFELGSRTTLGIFALWLSFQVVICHVSAQNNSIIIEDSLQNFADQLEVHTGDSWNGKIRNFNIGDYQIIAGRIGGKQTWSRENVFNTKEEIVTKSRFSFTMSGGGSDTASVSAERYTLTNIRKGIKLSPFYSIGRSESDAENLTAWIDCPGDTSGSWTLYMGVTSRNVREESFESFLTNGIRNILIVPISSDPLFDFSAPQWHLKKLPALGLSFVENGHSIGALQYFSGMTLKQERWVWLDRRQDAKMKLILVSAMAAFLQPSGLGE